MTLSTRIAAMLLLLGVLCGCQRDTPPPPEKPQARVEVRRLKGDGAYLVVMEGTKCVFRHKIYDYELDDNPSPIFPLVNRFKRMIDFEQDGHPEFVVGVHDGGNAAYPTYIIGRNKGRWGLWGYVYSGFEGLYFSDVDCDGCLDIIAAPDRHSTEYLAYLFQRTADNKPGFKLDDRDEKRTIAGLPPGKARPEKPAPAWHPPPPPRLLESHVKTEVRLSPDNKRNVFIDRRNVTQFTRPQHIYKARVSPNDRYLFVWHMDYSPRKVSIYDLSSKQRISTFKPGAGGSLGWADHNLI